MKSKKKVVVVCVLVLVGFYLLTEVLNKISVNKSSHSYETHCGGCHGKDGEGLGELIPPIANTDWLAKNSNDIPCIIKHGIKDSIQINGVWYNEEMVGLTKLTNIEITNITNYITSTWTDNYRFISSDSIAKILEKCK